MSSESDYITTFQGKATQLKSDAIAREWFSADASASEAARWANIGYMPKEAAAAMAGGETIESAEQSERNADAAGIWRSGKRIA